MTVQRCGYNKDEIQSVLKTINVGGLDHEALRSDIRGGSPQQWKISAGAELWLPVVHVKTGQAFVMNKSWWHGFTEDDEQDVWIRLEVADIYRFYSGRFDNGGGATKPSGSTDPKIQAQTRTALQESMPYNVLSRADGTGLHDNYGPYFDRFYGVAFEGQTVMWHAKNQSQVLNHGIVVAHYGWFLDAHGRSWQEILDSVRGHG